MAQAALALLGVTSVAFLLVSLSGDPAFILLTPEAGEAQRAAFREMYGLDQPLAVQYARYVAHVARGDGAHSESPVKNAPILHPFSQHSPTAWICISNCC